MRSNAAFLSKLSESVANESSSSEDEAPVKGKEKPSLLGGKGTKKLTALEKSPLFLKRMAEIAAATEDPSERDMIYTATSTVLNDALLTESHPNKSNVFNVNSNNLARGKMLSQLNASSTSPKTTDGVYKTSSSVKLISSSPENYNNQSPQWLQRKTVETADTSVKSQQPPPPVISQPSIYSKSPQSLKPSPTTESPKISSYNTSSTLSNKSDTNSKNSFSFTPKVQVNIETQPPLAGSPKTNRFIKTSSISPNEKGSSVARTESPKFVRTQSFDNTVSQAIKAKTYSSGAISLQQQEPHGDSPKAYHKKMPSDTALFPAVKPNILEGNISNAIRNELSIPQLADSYKGTTTSTLQKSLGLSGLSKSTPSTATTSSAQKSVDGTSARVQAFFAPSKSFKFHSPTSSPQGTPKTDHRKQLSFDKDSTPSLSQSSSIAFKGIETRTKEHSATISPIKSSISKQKSSENRDREPSSKTSSQNKSTINNSKTRPNTSTLTQNTLFLKRQAIVSAAEESKLMEEDLTLQDSMGNNSSQSPSGKNNAITSIPSTSTKGPVVGSSSSLAKNPVGNSISPITKVGNSPSPTGKDKIEKKDSTEESGTQSNPLYALSQSSLFLKRVALVNVDQQAVIKEKFIKGTNPTIQKVSPVNNHTNIKVMMNHESISDDRQIIHQQTTETNDSIDSPHSQPETPTSSQSQSNEYLESNSFDASRSFDDMKQGDAIIDESIPWSQEESPRNDTNNTSNESMQFNIQYEFGGVGKRPFNEQGEIFSSRSQYESFFQEDFSRSFDDASIGSYSNAANHKTAFTNDRIWENLFTDLDETNQDSTWGADSKTGFTLSNEDMMDSVQSLEESYSPWNMQNSNSGTIDDFESHPVIHTALSDEKMIRDEQHSRPSVSTFPDKKTSHSQDAVGSYGEAGSHYVAVDERFRDQKNLNDDSYNEQRRMLPIDQYDTNENDFNDARDYSVRGEPKLSLCKPYSVLLLLSSKAGIARISAPTLVSDFMGKHSRSEPRIQGNFSVQENAPSNHFVSKALSDPNLSDVNTARKSSLEEWNEKGVFNGGKSGVGSALSPYESTENISEWWKTNYAASQGDDVNKSVNQALFRQSPTVSETKELNNNSLFSTKSEDDIFSGIQDVPESQTPKNATPASQLLEVATRNPIVSHTNGNNMNNEETEKESSFIPPFASDRKFPERKEYPKYRGDLMTTTSDITFDINSRRDRKPLTMKEPHLLSGKGYHKALNSSKQRMAAQKPVSSTPPDGNLDTSALFSLLAGKITCGALGPLMAAFEDPSSNNKTTGIGISNSGRRARRYQRGNEDTTAIMEAASDEGPVYDDESHVGSEISSRIHLSKKEKKVWDSWERKDSENKPKPSALSPFVEDDNEMSDSMNNEIRRMKHQEKRALAHEKLLLHAYAALSLLPNQPKNIVNAAPFVDVLSSANTNNNKQAFERFCQGVKSGMAILKLNRDKKWHLRFLTVSQEGSWFNSGESRAHDNGYYPLGLLWVKKMNKIKGHSITSIDPDGRGGLFLADIVRIEECDKDIQDKFPLTKKQSRDYPDSVALRLQVDHKGITRFVTFRCSKAASTVIITGCQSAIALSGTYNVRNLNNVNVQK